MGVPLPDFTLAHYLAWENDQVERHEFYREKVFAMVGSAFGHHRVVVSLARRLDAHLEGSPDGWLLTDQTAGGELLLSSVAATLPFEQVFRGLDDEAG